MYHTGRILGFTLVVLVLALLIVVYLTGIPFDALAKTGLTAFGCFLLIGASHYSGLFRFSIPSASAALYWLVEGRSLMLAKARSVDESAIHYDYAVHGQHLPWYTTDWFHYVVVLLLFAVAFVCFKNGK
tara:strand:- start:43 stop:429 length:387 start_codon:yes stop_codon:yes gene_type:complete